MEKEEDKTKQCGHFGKQQHFMKLKKLQKKKI